LIVVAMNSSIIASLADTGHRTMRTLTWLKNLAVNTVTIIGLELAGSAPVGASESMSQHGYWGVVTTTGDDGRAICGVRTQMTDGAELRLIAIGEELQLVAYDPAWTMPADGAARVSIAVDGEVYHGKAVASDSNTLVVHNLSADFLEEFINGMKMEADFGGAHWTVSLIGSSRATSAMGQCMAAASRGITS
jgi:hypothetical protein